MSLEAKYRWFHATRPESEEYVYGWMPGSMKYFGAGSAIDIGYEAVDEHSAKSQKYIHKFGPGVKVYQRARSRSQADIFFEDFPVELMVLGFPLGFTYLDLSGARKEWKGSKNERLCCDDSGRLLVIVSLEQGVQFLFTGGRMQVRDWIYD